MNKTNRWLTDCRQLLINMLFFLEFNFSESGLCTIGLILRTTAFFRLRLEFTWLNFPKNTKVHRLAHPKLQSPIVSLSQTFSKKECEFTHWVVEAWQLLFATFARPVRQIRRRKSKLFVRPRKLFLKLKLMTVRFGVYAHVYWFQEFTAREMWLLRRVICRVLLTSIADKQVLISHLASRAKYSLRIWWTVLGWLRTS